MKCTLTVLFILAAAVVVAIFAWIAAAQGNGATNENCNTNCNTACNTTCDTGACGTGTVPAWYE